MNQILMMITATPSRHIPLIKNINRYINCLLCRKIRGCRGTSTGEVDIGLMELDGVVVIDGEGEEILSEESEEDG